MKKLTTILSAIILTTIVFAQAPEKMSYQGVVRDGSNNLVSSTTVGMRISILQDSTSGAAVYVETQIPNTNANGLASIEIGSGTIVNGDFATIDWANGPFYIKTETDPTGGTNYTITGTSQLLSVPYSLHSKTVEYDQDGNKTLSFSEASAIGQSYVMMDTIDIKAGKIVTIKGFTQTTGSECTVYIFDLTNNQWVHDNFSVYTIYEEEGVGYSNFQGDSVINGAVVPFSTTKKEFTTYFLPTFDFQLQIRSKELTATSSNGVGEASVIVIQ